MKNNTNSSAPPRAGMTAWQAAQSGLHLGRIAAGPPHRRQRSYHVRPAQTLGPSVPRWPVNNTGLTCNRVTCLPAGGSPSSFRFFSLFILYPFHLRYPVKHLLPFPVFRLDAPRQEERSHTCNSLARGMDWVFLPRASTLHALPLSAPTRRSDPQHPGQRV